MSKNPGGSLAISPVLEILSPQEEVLIDLGHDEAIVTSGTYANLSTEDHVWIFLQDVRGWYYLQNPGVRLSADGTWKQENTRPLREIQYILAAVVNNRGNRTIKRWVRSKRWAGIAADEIKNLDGYQELDRVKIRTPGVPGS